MFPYAGKKLVEEKFCKISSVIDILWTLDAFLRHLQSFWQWMPGNGCDRAGARKRPQKLSF
jgi:hypothetical protein